MKQVKDRPIRAHLRRYILSHLRDWEGRIEKGDDLRLAWHMRNVLLGILYRAGYVVSYERKGTNRRLVIR